MEKLDIVLLLILGVAICVLGALIYVGLSGTQTQAQVMYFTAGIASQNGDVIQVQISGGVSTYSFSNRMENGQILTPDDFKIAHKYHIKAFGSEPFVISEMQDVT